MKYLANKDWWVKAGVRALKTFAQAAIATIGYEAGSIGITDVNWVGVLSVSALAAVLSMLTSLAGIPEVGEEND